MLLNQAEGFEFLFQLCSIDGLHHVGIAPAQQCSGDTVRVGMDCRHDDFGGFRNARCSFLFANLPYRCLPVHLRHPKVHTNQIVALVILTSEADCIDRLFPVESDIATAVSG